MSPVNHVVPSKRCRIPVVHAGKSPKSARCQAIPLPPVTGEPWENWPSFFHLPKPSNSTLRFADDHQKKHRKCHFLSSYWMVLIHIHAAMRLYSPEMIYGCKLYLTRMSPVLMENTPTSPIFRSVQVIPLSWKILVGFLVIPRSRIIIPSTILVHCNSSPIRNKVMLGTNRLLRFPTC